MRQKKRVASLSKLRFNQALRISFERLKQREGFLYFRVFVLESIKIERLFLVSLLKGKIALKVGGYFERC